jgi:hypothetical protein
MYILGCLKRSYWAILVNKIGKTAFELNTAPNIITRKAVIHRVKSK